MKSFKENINKQIDSIESGEIFTFKDLMFPYDKFAHVAVILSQKNKKGELVRIEKGAYYKPKKSTLGLGSLPVYQDEQLKYLTEKLDGYITGAYIYNKMGLTEQVPSVITIATPKPIRRFNFKKLVIETVRSYIHEPANDDILLYLRLLDAIKDIKKIPGRTEQDVYESLKQRYFENYDYPVLNKIVSLAVSYPPRVRKILGDILEDMNYTDLQKELSQTIIPTTRFDLHYTRKS
ncbi:DUF6088 family protein [Bacteroides sp. 51]|uniref:DUF6088 family protein n=1 Tax=Bacteroides sp. 51 TaxID=2302938 RepID=UPI0013D81E3B|nr:DUF6088 family protein [Bacteroides sp. 51]NDV81554.1 hypothetical protein [Bacteroides sp. 51]